MFSRRLALLVLCLCSFPLIVAAQSAGGGTNGSGAPAATAGTLRLQSPDGRLVVTAVETTSPVRVDGTLDDEVWQLAQPVGGFVQSEPVENGPASEETTVRVAYDRNNLYIAAYCYDSDPSGIIVNNIREDFQPGGQDSFELILDTFADRSNGFIFMTNPEGARSDQQVTNEGREVNASWDVVWFVKTARQADGWTVEMSIPFKSLRFESGVERVWGVNFLRRIRRKNEVTYWSYVPRQFRLSRVSLAGNLAGLPASQPGRNLQIKPYVATSAVRATGGDGFDGDADVGLDLKYGVTPSLTLDVTLHPDFAQVEADEQEVNLTQFSQFFPEKREFFLENSGIFYVGDTTRTVVGNQATTAVRPDTDLFLFFSRRIGLTDAGEPIPILAGARLTGRAGGMGIGLMTIQTDNQGTTPANNYTVARVRKDLYANSAVGAIFLTRQSTDASSDYNRVYGVDANLRFFGKLDWSGSAVKTETPDLDDDQYAFRTSYLYEGRVLYATGGVVSIGENFNNEVGYYRRVGIRKYFQDTGLRPRPAALQARGIRELQPHNNWSYFTDQSGQMVSKRLHTALSIHFNDGGSMEISANPRFERLEQPFRIQRNEAPIPPGGYSWNEWVARYESDGSRVLSGSIGTTLGGLWSGTQRTLNLNLEVKPSHRFRVDVGMQRTAAKLDLPRLDFVRTLWTMRTNYSFSTNMFLDALAQYDRNLQQLNANIRFNLIHRPLSDIYVVYNEQRFTTDDPIAPGRGLILKFTQMMGF